MLEEVRLSEDDIAVHELRVRFDLLQPAAAHIKRAGREAPAFWLLKPKVRARETAQL